MAIRSTRNFGRSSPISTVSIYRGSQPRCSIGELYRGARWKARPGGALPGGSMEGLRHGGGAVQRRPELPSGRREHRRVHAFGQRNFVQHLFSDSFSDDPHLRRSQPSRVRSGEWSQEVHSVPCPVELRSEQTGRHPHSLPSPSFLHHGLGASNVRGSQQYRALTVPELMQHMLDPKNIKVIGVASFAVTFGNTGELNAFLRRL